MTEHPTLMNGAMVRATLADIKTNTRRIVKPKKCRISGVELAPHEIAGEINSGNFTNSEFGAPGDRLWVRETHLNWWSIDKDNPGGKRKFSHVAAYAADGYELQPGEKWIPSIHMLREASRIDLEITHLRIEKLQAISEVDAIAEGLHRIEYKGTSYGFEGGNSTGYGSATGAFRALWESIYGAGSFDKNPWVWVIQFKRMKPARCEAAA